MLSTLVSSNLSITSPGFKSTLASLASTTSTPVASNFIPHASPPRTNFKSLTLSLNCTLFATVCLTSKNSNARYAIIKKLIHSSIGSLKNIRRNKSFILKGNEIELVAYNKQQEIDNSSKKEYIKENLQMDKKIYRLEVRFKNFKQIQKALNMSNVDIEELYYFPFEDLLEQIFVSTLNRIIRLGNNKSILNYLLKIE